MRLVCTRRFSWMLQLFAIELSFIFIHFFGLIFFLSFHIFRRLWAPAAGATTFNRGDFHFINLLHFFLLFCFQLLLIILFFLYLFFFTTIFTHTHDLYPLPTKFSYTRVRGWILFGGKAIQGSRVIFLGGGGGEGVSPESRVQGPVNLLGYDKYWVNKSCLFMFVIR